MTKKTFLILLFCILLPLTNTAYAAELFGAKSAEQSSDLTIQNMLTYAIQDEYLAHAEYKSIINKYGTIRPFSNIIRAEEIHINMLIPLFKKYGFKLPDNNAEKHILIPRDSKNAVEIGVQAEIDNIGMYEKFLNEPLPEDIQNAFQRLKSASSNHLRAFRTALKRY